MFPLRFVPSALASFWSRAQRTERTAYVVGTLLLASGLIHLTILTLSNGSWRGPLSLRKPTTFGLSFGLTVITIAWVASFLRLSDRVRVFLLNAFTVACTLETALVTLQAWRGVPSHFNMETPFDASVARTLAAGGFVLVAVIVVLTLAAFRTNPTIPSSLRIAIQIGFVALVGAVVVGALMIAKGLARLDMTDTSQDMHRTDLKALVSDIVADAQWEARERDCRVDLVSDADCEIQANPDLLRSAAENVVRNAVRYTAAGTAVEVRLESCDGDNGHVAIIRVSDRGPGVPADELSNIFRPFYRVADARDRKSGGVGLGLAIAERVARVHGGSVRAEKRTGGGLEVVLTFKH
jgi:anti-sigma regulatory factor (Ser/Thr protein kinase)